MGANWWASISFWSPEGKLWSPKIPLGGLETFNSYWSSLLWRYIYRKIRFTFKVKKYQQDKKWDTCWQIASRFQFLIIFSERESLQKQPALQVARTKFLVALATRKAQFRTLFFISIIKPTYSCNNCAKFHNNIAKYQKPALYVTQCRAKKTFKRKFSKLWK